MRRLKLGIVARLLYLSISVAWAVYLFFAWQSDPIWIVHHVVFLAAVLLATYAVIFAGSAVAESGLYRKLFIHGRGGSARFAGPAAIFRHKWFFCRKAPIYLGKTHLKYDPWFLTQHVGIDDENHAITIAQPGSGKSTTAIWQNLVANPYPDSIFVLDPKGEHAALTRKHRERLGNVYILDPQGQLKGQGIKSQCYNPLDEIDVDAGDAKDRLADIAEACYVASGQHEHAHFRDMAQTLIAGLCAHVLSWPTFNPDQRNLPAVYDLLLKGRDDPDENDPFDQLLKEMSQNPAAGGAAQDAAFAITSAKDGERGGILTTTLRCLRWSSQDNMRTHLSRSDFSFDVLRKEVCTIYVVLDFADMAANKQGRYMRVLMNLAMRLARSTPMPQGRAAAGRRTLFILDEVGMLGDLRTIEDNYKILRSYRVKLWTLFQEYGTVEKCFENPTAIMSASTRQYFGVSEAKTAKHIEENLGQFVETRPAGTGDGRAYYESTKHLLTAQEVMDTLTQKELSQIVMTAGGTRFELRRIPVYPDRYRKRQAEQSSDSAGGWKQALDILKEGEATK